MSIADRHALDIMYYVATPEFIAKWTDAKIKRILTLMLRRDRITQAEFDLYSNTPLLFVKDGSETEEDCLKRTKKAIKNARSTNPLKR